MHWLRIDRYLSDDGPDARVLMQPMLCQHCEKAPCEYVCPVNATTHSPDGLNEMTYNRCVGTRFCSNNCPYKVRRFNWFDYTSDLPESERMLMNPDVTVRGRGVMEKCTYCVQRIRRHQIAEQTGRRDTTVARLQTACQQSCPTRAIEFGSLDEPDSRMVRMRNEPRSYSALHELGTEPRTKYLARITNPAPELREPLG
jgi:molybdopterin-containing oxidoreductase family iron-sulfur binding subunit